MEQKIALFSQYKGLLSRCAFALLSLLYPFSWAHVFIPILPESMQTVTEAPCPFFVGLETSNKSQYLSEDVIEVNLDQDSIESPFFKIVSPYAEEVKKKLKINVMPNLQKPDPILNEADQAFNILLISPDESKKFDHISIKNYFMKYMTKILGNYQRFIVIY